MAHIGAAYVRFSNKVLQFDRRMENFECTMQNAQDMQDHVKNLT